MTGVAAPQALEQTCSAARSSIILPTSEIVTIELNIAKSVFQVNASMRQAIRCPPSVASISRLRFFAPLPSALGVEACTTSHYWSRPLQSYGTPRKVDATVLREALGQATEERYGRCRGNLRSSDAVDDAVRGDKDARIAKRVDAAPCRYVRTCETSFESRSGRKDDFDEQRRPRYSA